MNGNWYHNENETRLRLSEARRHEYQRQLNAQRQHRGRGRFLSWLNRLLSARPRVEPDSRQGRPSAEGGRLESKWSA